MIDDDNDRFDASRVIFKVSSMWPGSHTWNLKDYGERSCSVMTNTEVVLLPDGKVWQIILSVPQDRTTAHNIGVSDLHCLTN